MAKLHYKTPDRAQPIEVELVPVPSRESRYRLRCGGIDGEIDVAWLDRECGWFLYHGRVVHFHAVPVDGEIEVFLDGRRHIVQALDRRLRRDTTSRTAAPVGELTAPMPGTILKINVAPGDDFAAHQPLIIMESMKMEMTLSTPHAGKVKEITCRVGELVPMGRLLAKLDSAESA